MSYKESYKKDFDRYKELLEEHDKITSDEHYVRVCEDMPFVFLDAKQKAETLELYKDLDCKDSAPFKFRRADEAITFFRGVCTLRQNCDEILENAAVIVKASELANELNHFVEESPYLPNDLRIHDDGRLVQIAKECLEKLPNYPQLMKKAFRNSFLESCIENLTPDGLKMIIQTKYLAANDLNGLRLTGSAKYESNIQFLQEYFGLKELIHESRTIRLAGTTKNNEDGSSRQANIAEISKAAGEKILATKKGIFHDPKTGKDLKSVEISWDKKILGYVPQAIVDEMYEKYGDPNFGAEFKQTVGGKDGLSYGCEVELKVIAKDFEKKTDEAVMNEPEAERD